MGVGVGGAPPARPQGTPHPAGGWGPGRVARVSPSTSRGLRASCLGREASRSTCWGVNASVLRGPRVPSEGRVRAIRGNTAHPPHWEYCGDPSPGHWAPAQAGRTQPQGPRVPGAAQGRPCARRGKAGSELGQEGGQSALVQPWGSASQGRPVGPLLSPRPLRTMATHTLISPVSPCGLSARRSATKTPFSLFPSCPAPHGAVTNRVTLNGPGHRSWSHSTVFPGNSNRTSRAQAP